MSPKHAPLVKAKLKELFPDRYQELPFVQALAALWKTPRIYKDHVDLVDPTRELVFGTLGNGLDPERIEGRKVALTVEPARHLPPLRGAEAPTGQH